MVRLGFMISRLHYTLSNSQYFIRFSPKISIFSNLETKESRSSCVFIWLSRYDELRKSFGISISKSLSWSKISWYSKLLGLEQPSMSSFPDYRILTNMLQV